MLQELGHQIAMVQHLSDDAQLVRFGLRTFATRGGTDQLGHRRAADQCIRVGAARTQDRGRVLAHELFVRARVVEVGLVPGLEVGVELELVVEVLYCRLDDTAPQRVICRRAATEHRQVRALADIGGRIGTGPARHAIDADQDAAAVRVELAQKVIQTQGLEPPLQVLKTCGVLQYLVTQA